MKLREGVLDSQWAGECGEHVTDVTEDEFRKFCAACKKHADDNKSTEKLNTGDIIDVELSGTDPEALEVTEVLDALAPVSQNYRDWLCKNCHGEGCAACNDGFRYGEDRFVVRHGPKDQPYVCLTRYYELLED